MEFEEWKDEAANYLEDAGIPYSVALDEQLSELWRSGSKPHDVVCEIRDLQKAE